MGVYILRRLLITIPLLLAVSFIVFSMTRFLPGDPAQVIAGPQATEQVVEQIRKDLGLDQPFLTQYGLYLNRAFRGDFGKSIWTRTPVTAEIGARFRATVELAVAATVIAAVVGVALGILASLRPNGIVDQLSMLLSVAGMSVPQFWLGMILLVYLAGRLDLFPIGGRGEWQHLVLPAVTLAVRPMALIARLARTNILDVLNKDYIRTARAKGLGERAVMFKHALKNALLPTITVIGLQFGIMLGGVIVIETVFTWPGVGRLLIQSIMSRDYPVLQAIVLMLAIIFSLVNLFVDIVYAMLDPRISYQ